MGIDIEGYSRTEYIKEGDTLVVSCDRRIPSDVYNKLVERVEAKVPGTKLLVLESGLRLDGVLRKGPA